MSRFDALQLHFLRNPGADLSIEMALVTFNEEATAGHGDGESKQSEHR